MASKNLNKTDISSRIRIALASSSMKQREIAAALGVSEVTISKYINGVSIPKNAYLVELAKILNVSVSWLLSGQDDGSAPSGVMSSPEPTASEIEWKRRALAAEKKLEALKDILPLISEANAKLSKIVF